MGSSNRDYMKDDFETQSPPTWGQDVPTTKWLLIFTVAVFFLQSLLTYQDLAAFGPGTSTSFVEEWFELDAHKILQGQVWRVVTYVFCHHRDNPWSLVFNMLGLWFLGSVLERMYGSRELLWFYLTAGAVSGVVFTLFGLKNVLPSAMMGSQSCVMALLTLYATHFPRQEILFAWVIPVQIRVLLLIYVAVDLYTIANAYKGATAWVVVAYTSQIWGVAFGYIYRRMNWRLSGIEDAFDFRRLQKSMRKASTARTLKVFHPEPPANLDEQVDAILAKIHEQGSESLTDRERSILQKASEQAKNRL